MATIDSVAGGGTTPAVTQSSRAEEPDAPRLTGDPKSIDRHIGGRIRSRRIRLGLSLLDLSQMLDVTYQQIHKYEHGINRISAARLFEISKVLGVRVSWFFDGLYNEVPSQPATESMGRSLELMRNILAIHDERLQYALSQLARALAAKNLQR